jgi:hypothetical protein
MQSRPTRACRFWPALRMNMPTSSATHWLTVGPKSFLMFCLTKQKPAFTHRSIESLADETARTWSRTPEIASCAGWPGPLHRHHSNERTIMKIEPSGVVMFGTCVVQTSVCVAKEPAPITAVWTVPGRTQINVCSACLDKQLRTGQWTIEGARPAAVAR